MTRTLTYWIPALLLLMALAVFCVRHHVPLIAEDLETRSRLALNDADLSGVTVEQVDGLNVVLGGVVANQKMRDKALTTVKAVHGVHTAIDEMSELLVEPVMLPAGQHLFSALADNTRVELTGMVRDSAMRASIVGAARRAFGERRVIDRLEQVASTPETWTPLLRELLVELAGFTSGKLDVRGSHLSLVGSVSSPSRKLKAETALTRVAGSSYTHRLDVAVLSASSEVIENCQASVNALIETSTVRFNSGSASISVDSYPLLDELADTVSGCGGVNIDVQGHTDANGDDQFNLGLSERRAQAVVDYFVGEGIEPGRLSATGYGESQPRADNSTRDGRARNRRIEFEITGN